MFILRVKVKRACETCFEVGTPQSALTEKCKKNNHFSVLERGSYCDAVNCREYFLHVAMTITSIAGHPKTTRAAHGSLPVYRGPPRSTMSAAKSPRT